MLAGIGPVKHLACGREAATALLLVEDREGGARSAGRCKNINNHEQIFKSQDGQRLGNEGYELSTDLHPDVILPREQVSFLQFPSTFCFVLHREG